MTTSVEVVPPGAASREEWLAARGAGIGASEIAAVLGLSPWQSAFGLWCHKTGHAPEPDFDTTAMRWGRRLEAAIADEYADRHPEFMVRECGLHRHPGRPWQLATPDRELCEHGGHSLLPLKLLECKTAGSYDGWGAAGTDEIPVYYRCQTLWQLDTLGVPEVDVAVLFNGHDYREYTVHRDEADLALMRAAGEAFWRRVETDDPPPLDGHTATRAALERLYPDVDDVEVEVPEPIAAEYYTALGQSRVAADRRSRAENALRDAMGRARVATFDGARIASRSVYEQGRTDVTALREHYPAAYRSTRTSTTVDKLNPPRMSKTTTIQEAVA